jgi:hypothetical protein
MPLELFLQFTQSIMNKFHHFIEINNVPVKNAIALEKEIVQNLTCNRWSQFVPVQWLKVNLSLFSGILSHY